MPTQQSEIMKKIDVVEKKIDKVESSIKEVERRIAELESSIENELNPHIKEQLMKKARWIF